jgi:hypothetical protein
VLVSDFASLDCSVDGAGVLLIVADDGLENRIFRGRRGTVVDGVGGVGSVDSSSEGCLRFCDLVRGAIFFRDRAVNILQC